MRLSITDIAALKKRISKTDGKLRAVCQLAGITDPVGYKLLRGDNIQQRSFDLIMDGLEQLESYEKEKRQANSRRIKVRLLSDKVVDVVQPAIDSAVAQAKPFKVIRKDDPVKPKKKKSIFQDKKLAGDLMIARFKANRDKAIERMREKKLESEANNRG